MLSKVARKRSVESPIKTITEVWLYGSLGKWTGEVQELRQACDLETPRPLYEVLKLLHIEPDQIQMAMVNHKAVPSDYLIHPGTVLLSSPKNILYLPIGRIFDF